MSGLVECVRSVVTHADGAVFEEFYDWQGGRTDFEVEMEHLRYVKVSPVVKVMKFIVSEGGVSSFLLRVPPAYCLIELAFWLFLIRSLQGLVVLKLPGFLVFPIMLQSTTPTGHYVFNCTIPRMKTVILGQFIPVRCPIILTL
jgi:hypothetical protein